MFSLPPVAGPYAVGATTFVAPVQPARAFGSAKRRRNDALSSSRFEPVLCMEEVAFTAYYPADTSAALQSGLNWLLRPTGLSLQGYSVFTAVSLWILWPIIYLFGIFVKIPVYTNAPLLKPSFGRSTSETQTPVQWPLVIFSHGLGGSRTSYSHLCSRLAASGKVVLAIEHRDGTGYACVTRSWLDDGKKVSRPICYLKENQAVWQDQPTERAPFALRVEQLEFRRNEIYTIYSKFCDILREEKASVVLETIEGHKVHESWTSMDCETGISPVKYQKDIALVGHSFGGCTMLSMLSTEPPPDREPLPATHAIILDPWLEPLPIPGPIPLLNAEKRTVDSMHSSLEVTITSDDSPQAKEGQSLPRLFVINSEAFTLWEDHFYRLQEVVRAWKPMAEDIITLVGSEHVSFSDFPILPVLKTKKATTHLEVIVSASLAFLDSDLGGFIRVASKRAMEVLVIGVKANGKPKRKLVGDVGDIIVH